jgi:DNA replication initiation complex subunit (GINS family)
MSEVIITFETIYDILRIEKSRNELQKLDNDFFQKVSRYMEEKNLILNSLKQKEAELEAKKTERQLDSFKKMLQELYEKRERKILELALFCSRTGKKSPEINNTLDEERELFENTLNTLNVSKKKILPKLNGKKTETFKNTILIRFLHSMPKFVTPEEHIFGPFEAEDVANLPKEVADLLILKNRAEEIKNEI